MQYIDVLCIKKFKKKIKNFPISPKEKEKIFTEFKSVILDKKYQRIKVCMLEHINTMDYSIYYAVYKKKNNSFYQQEKENVYISLLNKIVSHIDSEIDIIFDTFNKADFELKIIESIKQNNNVLTIVQRDSRLEYGLQFIDSICSIIRHHVYEKDSTLYYLLTNYNTIK